ncbi:unnamed protein product, partial [Ectocarpus sp. 8 AP-2014]
GGGVGDPHGCPSGRQERPKPARAASSLTVAVQRHLGPWSLSFRHGVSRTDPSTWQKQVNRLVLSLHETNNKSAAIGWTPTNRKDNLHCLPVKGGAVMPQVGSALNLPYT